MALIALAIKLESRGPALFGHVRIGKGGRPLRCLKFRSMRVGAEKELLADPELKNFYVQNDYKIPLELDPRVTRVGRFLRKSSLDELPQLFNVIAGTMSLVGPRPIVREELHWYGRQATLLLSVKPGITGPWQVQGRSRIGYPERTEVELEGVRRQSFWRDLLVLARSIPAVITARGSL
jgi:lipopolysaccharide/colanic/teichoic acid biosynthesis glycosyltransferase